MTSLGMQLFTWWKGEMVGEDGFGNRYYREKGAPSRALPRRWVIFKGAVEASKTPPEWHAWLHRTSDAPPSEKPLENKPWQQPHMPNLTGTAGAYRTPGQRLSHQGMPPPYQPWRPNE